MVSTPPLDQLELSDLIPYRTLTGQHPVAVMIGHLQVPGLTGTEPASLSAAAYQLLRSGGYGGPPFTGLIFTDDLSGMAAVTAQHTVPEAVLRALQAGADVALWISTDAVPTVLDTLERAVEGKELPIARVDEALARVVKAKTGCG